MRLGPFTACRTRPYGFLTVLLATFCGVADVCQVRRYVWSGFSIIGIRTRKTVRPSPDSALTEP
jgi:hypothetical protein